MPFIDIRLNKELSSEQYDRLAREVTLNMDSIMGKRKEVTSVLINSLQQAPWTIDSKGLQKPTAYVDIKITQGTNTEQEKAELISVIYQLLQSVLGELEEASYIVIHEINAGDWGYGGLSQAARKAAAL